MFNTSLFMYNTDILYINTTPNIDSQFHLKKRTRRLNGNITVKGSLTRRNKS